ncbi:hypothetical protein ES695_12395 [Candidatus Atribacteria bacterium 1244-E10-H5-B2]|nr:MAG: hypothetical protein ES695_12395 [Candidatus Atribacteria bacterium 1244-E10-H5-B2]
MVKVDKITGEKIEKLRGKVDFYLLRGITPVARRWPKKPKPPYTALQAEAMAVFAIANTCLSRISEHILIKWREGAVGKRASWTDTFRGIIMGYWKDNRSIAPIALDYNITEYDTEIRVSWDILEVFIDPNIEEKQYSLETFLIKKEDILKVKEPIYFTLLDDEKRRLVAPYILFEVEA